MDVRDQAQEYQQTDEFLAVADFHRFQNGDRAIFQKVYSEYTHLLFYVVRRCGIVNERGQDLVHDAFIKLYDHRRQIRKANSIKAWLVTTVRNLAIDQFGTR